MDPTSAWHLPATAHGEAALVFSRRTALDVSGFEDGQLRSTQLRRWRVMWLRAAVAQEKGHKGEGRESKGERCDVLCTVFLPYRAGIGSSGEIQTQISKSNGGWMQWEGALVRMQNSRPVSTALTPQQGSDIGLYCITRGKASKASAMIEALTV